MKLISPRLCYGTDASSLCILHRDAAHLHFEFLQRARKRHREARDTHRVEIASAVQPVFHTVGHLPADIDTGRSVEISAVDVASSSYDSSARQSDEVRYVPA